jgi:DNA replication protein DnaC
MLRDLYLKNSQIPVRYYNDISLVPCNEDLETFKELNDIRNNIKSFVDEGKNLLIYSNNVGNGKTTWSIKLLKAYIDSVQNISFNNRCPALFININKFLNEKKLAFNDKDLQQKVTETEKNILSAKLVVFDDIGVKALSDYDKMNVYYWIDERTNNMKSCIYTTNLSLRRLEGYFDDARIYNRVEGYSIVKEIKDGSNREC